MSSRRISLIHWSLLYLSFLLIPATAASAQISAGSLSGTVVDAQRAAIPNAQITITNVATLGRVETVTGADGSFHAAPLSAGTYSVLITKAGFKQLRVENAPVSVGSDLGLGELQLNIGETSTTITVRSASGLVERSEPQISETFGTEKLGSLPGIQENQGLDNLALLVPGVSDDRDLGFSSANGAQFSVNGLRGRNNDQQIDGQNNNDNFEMGPAISLADPEFVTQYEIFTGNFDAEIGRNSGGLVNIVTKSGTNDLHGSLYATESNWRLNSLSANQKTFEGLTQVPAFNDAFVGGTVGAPIARDKFFIFAGANSEIVNRTEVFATGQLTPTPAGVEQLSGCFPDNASVQALRSFGPYSVQAGKPSPLGAVTPVDIPGCGSVPAAGIQRALPADSRQYNFIVKLDYQTSKNHFSGRYIYARSLFSNSEGSAAAGYAADRFQLSQAYSFSWTRFFGPATANEFRASYGRNNVQDGGNSLGDTVPRAGMLGNALTFVSFVDPSLLSFGVPSTLPQGRIANTYQFHDNFTHVIGRHVLNIGVDVTHVRSPIITLTNYNGSFQFADFGAFAANSPSRIRIASGNPYLDFRETDLYPYAADNIRVTKNLVLTVGLTWSFYGQPANLLHNITIDSQTGDNPLWNTDLPLSVTTAPKISANKNSWAPGIGFAWSPHIFHLGDKTVLRGGYRLAYDPSAYIAYVSEAGGAPNVISTTLTGASAAANPLPAIPTGNNVRMLLGPHLQTGIFDPRGFGSTTVSPDFGPDRVHEWSLGVQQEISRNAAFEVRYVGNHGTRLFQTIDGNPYILGLANTYPDLVPAGLKPCPASQAAIPELIGRVNCTSGALVRERSNTGYSDYHGLQIELRSRSLWNQLTLQSSYTFSKTTDNTSEIGATPARRAIPRRFRRVRSTSRIRNTASQAWISLTNGSFPSWKSCRFSGIAVGLSDTRSAVGARPPFTFCLRVSLTPRCNSASVAPPAAIFVRIRRATPTLTIRHSMQTFALPDGSLRPFLGSENAPVQVGRNLRQDICASDVARKSLRNSSHLSDNTNQPQPIQQGFKGTTTDSSGHIVPDRSPPRATSFSNNHVPVHRQYATADHVFGSLSET